MEYKGYMCLLQPLFILLSNLWNSFQDEIVLLSVLSNMTTNLQPFLGLHEELFPDHILQPLLSDLTIKTDEERNKESEGEKSINTQLSLKYIWIIEHEL